MRFALIAATALGAAALSWTNWNGQQHCNLTASVQASTTEDVSLALEEARAKNWTVKPFGAGHSFSPIDLTDGMHIFMLPPLTGAVTRLSEDVVRVHAGLRLFELNEELEKMGLALPNIGSIATQTVAGATSTGTHGTGPTGSMSALIRGLTLVLANGTAVYASNSTNVDLFNAARTGYGAFGILVEVDLEVWPAFKLEYISWTTTLDDWLNNDNNEGLSFILSQYPRTQWYYQLYDEFVTVELRVNVSASTPITGCWDPGAMPGTPVTPPPKGWASWPNGTISCVDVSYKTLTQPDNSPRYTEMEQMIPVEDHIELAKANLAYQRAVRRFHNPNVTVVTGIRYVRSDDIWCSPFYGRNTAVFSNVVMGNATWGGPLDEVNLYDHLGLERIAAKYLARPHPGKVNWFTPHMMRRVYPKFDDFVALRKELDPTNMFSNVYLHQLFGF